MVTPRAILFAPVMAADDAASCVMHCKRDVVAIKQPDQTLRVEPFDKRGGVAAPLLVANFFKVFGR